MTTAPFLFLLILFLGRYMMRREDIAHASDDEGPVWRAALVLLWPLRLVARGLVALFWAVNGVAETIAGAAKSALRPSGGRPLLPRRAGRGIGRTVLYILLAVVLLFELFPFYFIFVTSFKSTLQIQQIRSMFWPDPWVLDHFVFLFTKIPFTSWYANTVVVTAVSTAISVFVASVGAYALVRLKWRGANVLGTAV